MELTSEMLNLAVMEVVVEVLLKMSHKLQVIFDTQIKFDLGDWLRRHVPLDQTVPPVYYQVPLSYTYH